MNRPLPHLEISFREARVEPRFDTLATASSIPGRFMRLAEWVVAEHDLQPPTRERLGLIVHEAMEAQAHFHAASMEEPTILHLDAFLIQFILNALSTASFHC